ncbi:MAG: hypothetical protein AAB834_06875, partial [Patescibacteria group bacterium]
MPRHAAPRTKPASRSEQGPLTAYYDERRGPVRKSRRYRRWQIGAAAVLSTIAFANINSIVGDDGQDVSASANPHRPAVAVEGHVERPATANPSEGSLECSIENLQKLTGLTETEGGKKVVRLLVELDITGSNVDASNRG